MLFPMLPLNWLTSTGIHNQTNFQIDHPGDWVLVTLPTAAVVTCTREPNALVSFMWFSGMGNTDPDAILTTTIHYNNILDYKIIRTEPVQTASSPDTRHRTLTQDALFTYRGEECRAQIITQITDAVSPFLLFWSGSIIWKQAPINKWDQYKDVINTIASSFRPGQSTSGETPQKPDVPSQKTDPK